MSQALGVVTSPDGNIQAFQGQVTLWQTSATTWTGASIFLPNSTLNASAVAACCNANDIPQVFFWGWDSSNEPALVSRYKESTAPGASWSPWSKFQSAPNDIYGLRAARAASGRIQLFATGTGGTLITSWESSSNTETSFTTWEDFSAETPKLGQAGASAVTLVDGRLQLWGVTAANALITCYKESTAAGAPWSPWSEASPAPESPFLVAGALRPDGRVQLWCGGAGNKLFTTFQTNPPSTTLETWASVTLPPEMTEVSELAVATLNDGRLQLFVWAYSSESQGSLFTQYQTSTASSAPWSAWQQLSTKT